MRKFYTIFTHPIFRVLKVNSLVAQFVRNDTYCTTNNQKVRNNDYFNPKLGIILEDLHDENVLTNNGILYFIDTVFYLK